MLLPHITTKDANGAGSHKSWFPFPVLHLQSRDRDTNFSRAHFGVAKWAFYFDQPFRGPRPLYRESGRFCKYPWGSDLDKGELGTEPSSVHPLPSGAYCRSPSLLSTWAILCVGKLLYWPEGINSLVKFWVNPQYFSQIKNWVTFTFQLSIKSHIMVMWKTLFNMSSQTTVCGFLDHQWPTGHSPGSSDRSQCFLGSMQFGRGREGGCQRNAIPTHWSEGWYHLVQRYSRLLSPSSLLLPHNLLLSLCGEPISQTISSPQHSGFIYDTVWMKNGQVGGKRHQRQHHPAVPSGCSCTPKTSQTQKASFDSSPCHWKMRRRGQKQIQMNVCKSQLLHFSTTHPLGS